MKFNPAVAKSLLMAASIGMVVPLVAQTAPKPSKPTVPAKPAPDEPPAKIDGITLPRGGGGFLGLTVEGARMVLKFYDADKKPVTADLSRVAARWTPVNRKGEERSMLNPDETGRALVSTPVVRPPLVFRVYLTLFDASGAVQENMTADLRELDGAKE
jgi:hypothetical protein